MKKKKFFFCSSFFLLHFFPRTSSLRLRRSGVKALVVPVSILVSTTRRWPPRCRGPCRACTWRTEEARARRRGQRHPRRRRLVRQQLFGMLPGTRPFSPRPLAASGGAVLLLSGSFTLARRMFPLQLAGRARRRRSARGTTSWAWARRWSISRRPSTTRFWPNSAWPREGGGEFCNCVLRTLETIVGCGDAIEGSWFADGADEQHESVAPFRG